MWDCVNPARSGAEPHATACGTRFHTSKDSLVSSGLQGDPGAASRIELAAAGRRVASREQSSSVGDKALTTSDTAAVEEDVKAALQASVDALQGGATAGSAVNVGAAAVGGVSASGGSSSTAELIGGSSRRGRRRHRHKHRAGKVTTSAQHAGGDDACGLNVR